MKIILVNPTPNLVKSNIIYRNFVLPLLPSGLGYISTVLANKGHEVLAVDLLASKISDEKFMNLVKEAKPQIVGFSCLTTSINRSVVLAKKIKSFNEKIWTIFGNIHPTIFADELLNQKLGDVVVRGEGEITMSELVSAIENKASLHCVKGISFRENEDVFHNQERELIDNLDDLAYPAWDLFDFKNYRKGCPMVSLYDLAIPIVGSRGCPFSCTFCSQERFYKRPRYRDTIKIVDEFQYMHEKYKAKFFGFTDANFPFSIKQGHEFCDEMIRRGLNKKVRWITETRVDLVNLELLKKMKAAGLHAVMYGFEVGDPDILKSLKKGTTLEQAKEAMDFTKKAGILSVGLFMLGLPGETEATCRKTINFAKEIDCDFAKFNITVVYPGSELFKEAKNKKEAMKHPETATAWSDWFGYANSEFICAPEKMTAKELINLQRHAMFEFYVRPKMIVRHILKRTISFKNLILGGYILVKKIIQVLLDKLQL